MHPGAAIKKTDKIETVNVILNSFIFAAETSFAGFRKKSATAAIAVADV